MSLLTPDFQFSQRSLQDYTDCRRRFQLRYIDRLAWPAIESEPVLEQEQRMRMGAEFHRLLQRHLLGVPAERLTEMLASAGPGRDDLKRWWENYLQYGGDLAGFSDSDTPAGNIQVEATLSAPLGNYRLLAKFDLIRWFDGKGLIVDWKTSHNVPPKKWLAERLQTRVYPYLLAQVGLPGEKLSPDQIEMVYWYPEHPQEPQRFPYSLQQHHSNQDYLSGLVSEIESLDEDEFYLTPKDELCKFCTYRSLCDRGISAGTAELAEFDPDSDGSDEFILDFDHIAEIEF